VDFPQLDLVDLSFDLGQLPDLAAWGQDTLPTNSSRHMEVQAHSPQVFLFL
jgi:hypothetical protein